jgi:hypothetical protein
MTPKMGEIAVQTFENSRQGFVSVKLSQLAFEALSGGAHSGSQRRVAHQMEGAIRCYLGDRDSGRAAWPYPAFLRGSEVQEDVELRLSIDGELWRGFEAEAKRQDVSVQQLAEHAAFYLAAELDAGRVTQRILDDLESSEEKGDASA